MSNGKKNGTSSFANVLALFSCQLLLSTLTGFGRLTMGDGWSYYEGQWLNDEMQVSQVMHTCTLDCCCWV